MGCGSQNRFWFCLLLLSLILGINRVRALERQELFKFGIEAGDEELQPGGDSSTELHLKGTFFFFNAQHQRVHVSPEPSPLTCNSYIYKIKFLIN